jgi:hypothetical protein
MGIEKNRGSHEQQVRLSRKIQRRRTGMFFTTEGDFDKINNSVHVTRFLISRLTADTRIAKSLGHTRKEDDDVFENSDRDINMYSFDIGGVARGGYHVV